jgi:hypothetical protein
LGCVTGDEDFPCPLATTDVIASFDGEAAGFLSKVLIALLTIPRTFP